VLSGWLLTGDIKIGFLVEMIDGVVLVTELFVWISFVFCLWVFGRLCTLNTFSSALVDRDSCFSILFGS